jgi:hypothetical protein
VRFRFRSGVVISTTLLLAALAGVALTVLLMAAQRHYHQLLVMKIDEFIEQVSKIDMSQSFEMNADAMEMQMQAAKQAQIFDFLRSVVQPNISVQEVSRSEDGKFSAQ